MKITPGTRCGRWTVVGPDPDSNTEHRHVICRCDCGTIKSVAANNLSSGRSRSCGCYRDEKTLARSRTHGATSGSRGATTPEYRCWMAMKQRCLNPHASNYHWYGARGIRVCERWLDSRGFQNFLSDMGPRPPGMTVDRIDPSRDYEPSNCRWATHYQQMHNRRSDHSELLEATKP